MRPLRFIICLMLLIAGLTAASAQSAITEAESVAADSLTVVSSATDSVAATPARQPRKITPVDVDDDKPRVVLHYYDKHGEPLKEPVMFLATLDTVKKAASKPLYPLYNGVTVGANFGDLLFMAFGQKYASVDLHADVSLHNWFFPTLEAGVGFANATPGRTNFTYKVKPSFYAKIGMNYNFVYKSNPDYQVFAGLRLGFSSFDWDVKNVTINSDYWGEETTFNMPSQRSTALWGELLAGIKVKIVGNFSLGWSVRWHQKFHVSKGKAGEPWFIPGYGADNFGFSLSAMWTIPAKKKLEPEIDPDSEAAPDTAAPAAKEDPGKGADETLPERKG